MMKNPDMITSSSHPRKWAKKASRNDSTYPKHTMTSHGIAYVCLKSVDFPKCIAISMWSNWFLHTVGDMRCSLSPNVLHREPLYCRNKVQKTIVLESVEESICREVANWMGKKKSSFQRPHYFPYHIKPYNIHIHSTRIPMLWLGLPILSKTITICFETWHCFKRAYKQTIDIKQKTNTIWLWINTY